MRKLLLIFLFIIGCNLQGDNDPKFLKLVWDSNVEPDVTHYEVFFWQGDDTLSWSIPNMALYESVNQAPDSVVSSSYTITYNYIRGGAKAVDNQGLKSDMGLSRFYSYAEFFAPSSPVNVRIKK